MALGMQEPKRSYRDFSVAIYARAYEVREMVDLDWLAATFDVMQRNVRISKVYLETHRDNVMPDRATIEAARRFFADQGVATSGGITYTVNERNRFETFCYTRPESRARVQEIAEYTASLFDEFILDDFFFTNCKCPHCIEAKGDQSWTEFRLRLMSNAGESLVVGPAQAVNPDVRVTIKYPNWYEHFPALGFDLVSGPALFDALYTGSETRDPILSNQHLQPYGSYLLYRYLDAIKPGANQGGWVDPFGSRTIDRYAEQLWLTVLAKAPEVTLFDFRSLQRAIEMSQRAPWQDGREEAPKTWGVGIDFDEMVREYVDGDGTLLDEATVSLAAGHAFEAIDSIASELGRPVGVASYRPCRGDGEDFLHNYLGMLGIPIALKPTFPEEPKTVLLTESARVDPDIVGRISGHLRAGNQVVVTSGLYRALQGGVPGDTIEDIAELEVTDAKALVREFLTDWRTRASAAEPILLPHVRYKTNDAWEEVSGLTDTTGHPVLTSAVYATGKVFVLTVPDNFDDLYKLPRAVLERIRQVLLADLPVRIDAPAYVTFFLYDNGAFIVENFGDDAVQATIVATAGVAGICDLLTGHAIAEAEPVFDWRGRPTGVRRFGIEIGPHMLRGFRYQGCR